MVWCGVVRAAVCWLVGVCKQTNKQTKVKPVVSIIVWDMMMMMMSMYSMYY
jgi:hypothetical protein